MSPIAAAKKVFHPHREDRIVDPTVRKLQFFRAWAGLVVTVLVLLIYTQAAPKDIADERMDKLWINMLATMCVVPVVVAAFILASRDPNRGSFLRRAGRPLLSVVALFGTAFVFPLTMAPELKGLRGLFDPVAPVMKPVFFVWMLCWLVPFFFYGFFLCLTHVFRTVDIHELVPPLISVSLAWVLTLIDVINDSNKGVPPGLSLALLLGAPLSVTALAAFETHRLRKFHAITLRNTLLR
ncbi:hypothetical protein [Spirillospora sp. CA-294931]|uniref:hypothetical protein n=1 Tax=Spirillospora sp. CA-294931 TaxID=3240042 RepID=UPI003D942397